MTTLAVARKLLLDQGYVCTEAPGGGLLFCGRLGCGRANLAADGRVRLGYDASAVADDPLAYARISSRPGPARVTLRRRTPVAELLCDLDGIGPGLQSLAGMWAPEAEAELPVVDVRPGVLGVVAPPITVPQFIRLALPYSCTPDRARATYLLVANAHLRSGKGGWVDGPGVYVDPQGSDLTRLSPELLEVGRALAALGDVRIAESYLALCGMRPTPQPRVPTGDAKTEKEEKSNE